MSALGPEAKRSRPRTRRKFVVCPTSAIADGDRLVTDIGGRSIGVFNVGGEFFALLNHCPHLGGPLCRGGQVGLVHAPVPGDVRLDDSRQFVTCPWHGWEFDIQTGRSYIDPVKLRVRSYEVEVAAAGSLSTTLTDGTGERIPGPYVAETIPVSVEDDYVVVTL